MFAHGRLDDQIYRAAGDHASHFSDWADAPLGGLATPKPTTDIAPALPDADVPDSDAIHELRRLASGDQAEPEGVYAWHLPPPDIHVTGSTLRRQLVTAQSIAELAADHKPSLAERVHGLFKRK